MTEPVACHACGHGYPDHDPDGGHCTAELGYPPVRRSGVLCCPCPGFRWVDPDGPAVGSYTDPPRP